MTNVLHSSKSTSTNFIWNLAPPCLDGQEWAKHIQTGCTIQTPHQAYNCTNHSNVNCICKYLSSYWWEFKNHNIKANESCINYTKYKENYGMCPNQRHCKWSRRLFVTMPILKGNRYILIILDNISWYLMTIPCARNLCHHCHPQTIISSFVTRKYSALYPLTLKPISCAKPTKLFELISFTQELETIKLE